MSSATKKDSFITLRPVVQGVDELADGGVGEADALEFDDLVLRENLESFLRQPRGVADSDVSQPRRRLVEEGQVEVTDLASVAKTLKKLLRQLAGKENFVARKFQNFRLQKNRIGFYRGAFMKRKIIYYSLSTSVKASPEIRTTFSEVRLSNDNLFSTSDIFYIQWKGAESRQGGERKSVGRKKLRHGL